MIPLQNIQIKVEMNKKKKNKEKNGISINIILVIDINTFIIFKQFPFQNLGIPFIYRKASTQIQFNLFFQIFHKVRKVHLVSGEFIIH